MTDGIRDEAAARLRSALRSADGSARVQAALSAGTYPQREYVGVLVDRCAVEPDFHVREMLTWALIRQDRDAAVAGLLPELTSAVPQARSQALHTLSKIGDPATWSAITPELLHDDHPDVARAAWRTAAILAPDDAKPALAIELARHFARGDGDRRRSLTRALVMLGEAAEPVIRRAAASSDADVRTHAYATEQLLRHPDDGYDAALQEARRRSATEG